jgi:chromosomal replication initiation ATPase DnaA
MNTQKVKRVPRGTLLAHKRLELDSQVYNQVIEIVANEFGLPVSKMICKRRNFELVMARNMAFYILHTTYRQRASQIGPYFHRDRTTVLHAVNNFSRDLRYIPFYMERYESILKTLGRLPETIYALQ